MLPRIRLLASNWAGRIAISAILAWMPLHSVASTAPVVDSKLVTYGVSGQTIDQIQRSIAENTPSRNGGSYYAGVTIWSLSASYDLIPAPHGCLLDNGQVFLKIRIHLPVLESIPKSPGVEQEWRRFYSALNAHEALHAQNAYRAATTLLAKINGTRTDVPCSRAKVIAEKATAALIERISAYDKDLDIQTRHGATQGAYLNPVVR
uniref:Conserved hypothetical exported protein n=1 Tax=Pseudomonas fluorescens (strain SBW25) TaxID=216595 RepID=A4V7J9_PSEFS|nr:conserved hypothetical exported protein [Pseudomonas fluorescens SBW25]